MRLAVTLPETTAETNEPLLVTGKNGAADFLFIRYLDGRAFQIGYDAWGYGGPMSKAIPYRPNRAYRIGIDMPSLHADSTKSTVLLVTVDGREVLRKQVHYHPTQGAVQIAFNPAGGTACSGIFSGKIELDVFWSLSKIVTNLVLLAALILLTLRVYVTVKSSRSRAHSYTALPVRL
jgi:hypothetical protein